MEQWIDSIELPTNTQETPEDDRLLDLIESLLLSREQTRPFGA